MKRKNLTPLELAQRRLAGSARSEKKTRAARANGARGGAAASPAQRQAARANGTHGGRPRLPNAQLTHAAQIKRRQRARAKKAPPQNPATGFPN